LDEPREALTARAQTFGYLYFPAAVPLADVLELRNFVLACAADLGWLDERAPFCAGRGVQGLGMGAYDDPRWVALLQRVLVSPLFDRLRRCDAIRFAASIALGGEAAATQGDICRVVSGDDPAHTTPPHQDAHYIGTCTSLVTAWLPLGQCPMELGALAVLPGSHRAGLRPHGAATAGAAGCEVPAGAAWHTTDFDCGDVLVFDGRTVHRALPHRLGQKLRLSVDYRFTRRDDVLR
jgi:hypothetical protein